MMDGKYYKEWSPVLGREMEFKVYGHTGVPMLGLPARGGRFYDWENNGMPDAVAHLIHEGKIQLFTADSIDGESLLASGFSLRRRAEMQEKYFLYLTAELAPRILALNAASSNQRPDQSENSPKIWAVGVDTGACQAANCRLRRPALFQGAIGLSGLYDLSRFWGSTADDLVLRNSPLTYLAEKDLVDSSLAEADEGSLILCVGQGDHESEALGDTKALEAALINADMPVSCEIWGSDVSHDWYWWGKELSTFAQRLF